MSLPAVEFPVLLNEVSIPDKYITSVSFLEELGKEILFGRRGPHLLDQFLASPPMNFELCKKKKKLLSS